MRLKCTHNHLLVLVVCGILSRKLLPSVFRGNEVTNPKNRKKTPARVAFGKVVRQKRQHLKLTQEVLAERAQLHPTYIGSVERGERNIALENIIALAKALGCSSKHLMPD